MGFLSSSSCVSITVQMHHMDADKTYRKKARSELRKNATSYIDQIQEATPNKITAVQPTTSYL